MQQKQSNIATHTHPHAYHKLDRDSASRPPVIPPGVAEARARREAGEKRKTQRDFQEEAGGAGG